MLLENEIIRRSRAEIENQENMSLNINKAIPFSLLTTTKMTMVEWMSKGYKNEDKNTQKRRRKC